MFLFCLVFLAAGYFRLSVFPCLHVVSYCLALSHGKAWPMKWILFQPNLATHYLTCIPGLWQGRLVYKLFTIESMSGRGKRIFVREVTRSPSRQTWMVSWRHGLLGLISNLSCVVGRREISKNVDKCLSLIVCVTLYECRFPLDKVVS